MFFVFIAFVFWLLNALNYDLEDNVAVKVDVKGVPGDIMFITPQVQTVDVRIRDKGTKLINYIFRVRDLSLDIDFDEIDNKDGRAAILTRDLLAARGSFPQTTSVVSVQPDTLFFEYTNSKAIKLPVKLNSMVRPDIYHYVKSVSIVPDSVTVYLPQRNTTPYDCVETLLIPQQSIGDSTTIAVGLKEIPGAKLIPEEVSVSYEVDVYVDKVLQLPVTAVNFPYGVELKTFPTKVDVAFQIGSDDMRRLRDKDFGAVIDYKTLDLKSEKADVTLQYVPDYVRNARLLQTQVDYLLEWALDTIPQEP